MPRLGCEPFPAGAVIPVGTAANGDILYYDSGAWQLRTIGSSGQVLAVSGGLPVWGANGNGDVVGPASAADNHIALYDGTTGKLIKDSLVHVTSVGRVQPAADNTQAIGVETLAWTKVWAYGHYVKQQAAAVAPVAGWASVGAFWTLNSATTVPRFTDSTGTGYTLAYDPTTTLGDLSYRGASLLTRLAIGSTGQRLTVVGGAPAWASTTITQTIIFIVSGGGSAITTGSKGFIAVDYACTITGVTLLADQSGSIVIDIQSGTYAAFPTNASICAAAKPTLSAAQKSQDTTLTGWTTAVTAGNILEFVVDSASTVTQTTVVLTVTRSI
jgi:hypothetical protein